MSYFIFKGISSDTMGVILTELPPITKPPKKYRKYDVIGKDGTEIKEDGYTSYPKPLSIGIKDPSNIDQIIDWLDGSGQLIISSEPDKFYTAKILEQADYTSLLRFRQATVVFEIQPFKYAVANDVITKTSPFSITNDGNYYCLPTLTIYGSGNVTVKLDGADIFTITSVPSSITVDGMTHNCYNGAAKLNRKKIGDYLRLPTGTHTISWTGTVSKVEMAVNKRWL